MSGSSIRSAETCPFIDHADPRCAAHFTLSHLSQTFGHCFGAYQRCPQYHRLFSRQYQTTALSIHGRTLQPTGT